MKIKEITGYIFAEKEDLSLEERLFLSSIIIGILTSLFGSLINILVSTSVVAGVVPLFLSALLGIVYYFVRFKKVIKSFIVPLIIVSMIGISVVWVFNGGINGSNSITSLVILILGLVIVPDKLKKYVLALFVSLNIIIYLIQFYRPDLITNFPTETERWIDAIITLTYVSFFIFFIMKFLHKNYRLEKQRAEESEKRYRAFIETANEGVLVAQGNDLKYVNPMVSEIIGYTAEELLSKPFMEFIHPDYKELMINNYENRLKGEEVENRYHLKILSKNKGEVWVEMSGAVIDWEGQPATLNFVSDISKRKIAENALQESELQFKSLFKNAADAMFIADKQTGIILDANDSASILMKMPVEDIIGKHQSQLHPPENENISRLTFDKHKEDIDKNITNNVMENQIIRPDKSTVPVEILASSVIYKGKESLMGTFRDISERKRVEEEIKFKNAELAELNASKDKFFSIIAHDLKNPFGNFKDVTKLLADSYNEFSELDRLEYLKLMKDATNNIYELLENLLDWSRSQQGKININPIDFNLKLVTIEIIKLLKHSSDKKTISIENNLPVSLNVLADINLTQTLIRNLISNAIKFTHFGGKIEIGVLSNDSNFSDESNEVCIYIKDSGIGMSKDVLNKLFRIDTQVSSSGTNMEKGTGLGLILCKEFVEKQGGKIWAESEVGKGSTFFVTLEKNNSKSIV